MGKAFDGTGEDLGRIIDSGNAFIEAANDNFDVTTALIRDSNTVLKGQVATASAIREFAAQLRAVQRHPRRLRPRPARRSSTPAPRPPPSCARSSRTTRSSSAELINNLVTTGEVVVKHLDGIEQILVDLPLRRRGRLHRRLEVAGHRAVRRPLRPDPHQQTPPSATRATRAPTSARRRTAATRPMNENARCTEPAAAEQRPRCRSTRPARRRGVPRAGRGVVRPRHRQAPLGRARSPPALRSARYVGTARPSERSRGSGCSSSP